MDTEKLDDLSSTGYINGEKMLCQFVERHKSRGIWLGDNPLHHTSCVIAFEIIIVYVVGRLVHLILRPCHQSTVIAQIVAGIIMGPSLLGRINNNFEQLFPAASRMTLRTFAEFGMIIHFFRIGVEIDFKQLFRIGKEALIIGLSGHISAIIVSTIVFIFVSTWTHIGPEGGAFYSIVVTSGLTSFVVVSGFLTELNILNSEIGRLALSSAMVSDACMWIMYFAFTNIAVALKHKTFLPIIQLVFSLSYLSVLFILLRPLVIWISRRNPKGKPMTQGYFVSIMFILFFVGISAQCVGQPAFFATFLFGVILPDGPPLGSVLTEKLDVVGSTLLVPAYITISGLNTGNVPTIIGTRSAGIEIVILAGYIGKFVGTIIPSIHFEVQFWDSITLALIMCCRGILDLIIYYLLFNAEATDNLIFSLQVYTMVIITGSVNMIVYHIYDPSRRYKSYIRRSIRESQQDINLKILVCIHNEENVYPIINLLQVSNPTKATPLSVFVLHLMELSGRASSILTKNKITNHSPYTETSSKPISNVFDQFEKHNKGCVTLQFFTSITPYASMHDDICYMAMDTKSSIVIVPFHKQWTADGNSHIYNNSIRILNQNVLKKAPCSVGVLVDRSQMRAKLLIINEKSYYEIAMIFLGGADDQEALAYSLRIAQHPNVKLTVFWVRAEMHIKQYNMKNPYIDLMEHIRYSNKHKRQVTFKEEIVEDGLGITQIIRTMEGYFSLVIVGRHHVADSPCTLGLTEWCELPELGPMGNLLAVSDFTFSVLVVQQQHFNCEFKYVR
ncbi:hypothetical protein TanjilG_21578 [Lupinus angustifolius]|uniref:Uncharacterized protein n=1 Tax=Lupinus angustifolius TaxID=3871 RepID=A0A4P1QUG8_LUPAN|nr:PREDICTED: cation/H(+) antiporter 14-like [Lupinus angustifolius]OIV95188.1 hypothetical protein TanjilG_21578 [Lupinus angustifolius]